MYMLAGFLSLIFPSPRDEMSLIGFVIDAVEDSSSKTNAQVLWRK